MKLTRIRNLFRQPPRLELILGDITTIPADVIVNAAKPSLLGGGGVDGAIHKAAGPGLLASCKALRATLLPDGLHTGDAIATRAGLLPASYVIHTVGPRYDRQPYASLLRSCYTTSIELAAEFKAASVSFPLISSGVYGWPVDDAIRQAVHAIRSTRTSVKTVQLVLYDPYAYDLALSILDEPA